MMLLLLPEAAGVAVLVKWYGVDVASPSVRRLPSAALFGAGVE